MTRYQSRNEVETEKLAKHVSRVLHAGDVLLLRGPMGAGKTAFVRGLACGLGIDPALVSSPTFVLQHIYEGGSVPLVHMDLYRLQNVDLYELGFEDHRATSITAIEWPEQALEHVEPPYIEVDIVPDEEGARTIALRAVGGRAPAIERQISMARAAK